MPPHRGKTTLAYPETQVKGEFPASDLRAARRYLAELGTALLKASISPDPRVIITAVGLAHLQGREVRP